MTKPKELGRWLEELYNNDLAPSSTKTPAFPPFPLSFLITHHASWLKRISLLWFLQRDLLLDGFEGVGVLLDQILAPFLILLFCRLHVSLLTFDDLQVALVLCQFSGSHGRMLCSRSTREGPCSKPRSEVCEPFCSCRAKTKAGV